MIKDLSYYMGLNYRIEIIEDKDEGGYVLKHPELIGCITCADTIEEGLEMLKDAKKVWVEGCLEDGFPIPEPTVQESYSGQFKIRMPKSLHKKLSYRSKQEGVSMNHLCVSLLSENISVR